MRIAVIGHTGMGGRALTEVLLARGHRVTGISRGAKPSEDRPGLQNAGADVFDVDSMTGLLEGHDAVVSMFSGGHEVDLEVYYRQAEGTRRLLKAFRQARGSYLLYVGGAASLYVRPGVQMFDDERFPSWYFGVMPAEHLRWLGDITGVGFFHDAARRKEDGTVPPGHTDAELEAKVASWQRVPLLEGCRIALDLFEGRVDIDWSFLSPPWLYRPGSGRGGYRTGIDRMIFDEGIPSGIALPDLALAVADEVERRAFVHRHWTVAEPLEGRA
ncbi:NAD(P)H-binding protein [Streptomyces sp. MB09-01]|uniref:NAD(P)-dependent oxidoreductase n=1 Tax=Streptomyces sp. MB09-01 TaxID=3028666 RepID=UPI0029A07085|nr:NAD(P)H-binding protein [Streptomyces sp. MB09-01]MDX3537509.1 NAD(P)H-binding protein [Streptomyces sp. MB09-01]